MADRPDIIKNSMDKARRSWEQYLLLQEKALYNLFDQITNDLSIAMARAEQGGRIPPFKTKVLTDQVKSQIPILRRQLSSSIKRGISNSIDQAIKGSILSLYDANVKKNIQVGTSFIGKDGTVRRFNIAKERYIDSAWRKMNQRAVKNVLSWAPDGVPLSGRVWKIGRDTQTEILKALNQGILRGRSAAGISRDIRQLLRMPTTLRGKRLKDYHPGRGVYKSAYKNAMRLARTELNQAFWEGTRQYAQAKPWIDGYIWRLGNVDACPLCLPHSGEFFPKDEVPEQPHPQCLCHLELHIKGDPKPRGE